MINRRQIEISWKQYVALYKEYIEQLKRSKHHYTLKNCPLCEMEHHETALDPEVRWSFGRTCPLCGDETYWAF